MSALPYEIGLKYFSLKTGLKHKTQHRTKEKLECSK